MDFLNFSEFQHYVTACYVTSAIGIVGICLYTYMNSKKQYRRLKSLEQKFEK